MFQGSKLLRVLTVTIIFVTVNFCRINSTGKKSVDRAQYILQKHRNVDKSNAISKHPPPPHIKYHFMLREFQSLAIPNMSPSEIAEKYGIPRTPRENLTCDTNGTTAIGWIPSDPSHGVTNQSSGLISRFIFQSWVTNDLVKPLCDNAISWSLVNPEYDYFLFDDSAVDRFILLEYGRDIFEEYSCINVGAGKCDVWRLFILYLFGGIYFDLDCRPKQRFAEWGFGNHTVVTGRARPIFGNGAHQWGMIYSPRHPVMRASIIRVLENLWQRTAAHVYEIGYNAFQEAWVNGQYNQSHMPGWGPKMGGRVVFQQLEAKVAMESNGKHWRVEKDIWRKECTVRREPW